MTLKDSFCYLSMPLSKMPKAFELVEAAKGDFPHFFNTPENEDYIGPWPAKEYYTALNKLQGSAREEFLHWHDEQKDKVALFILSVVCNLFCLLDIRHAKRDGSLLRIGRGHPSPLYDEVQGHLPQGDGSGSVPPSVHYRCSVQQSLQAELLGGGYDRTHTPRGLPTTGEAECCGTKVSTPH